MNRKQTGRSHSNANSNFNRNSSYPSQYDSQRDQYRTQKSNADYSNYNANSNFSSDYEDEEEFAPQNQSYREADSYENPRRSSYNNNQQGQGRYSARSNRDSSYDEGMSHAQNDFGSYGATPKNQYGQSTYGNTRYGNPSANQFSNDRYLGSSYNNEEFLGKNTGRGGYNSRNWNTSDRYDTNEHFSTEGSSWGRDSLQNSHQGKGPKGYKRADSRIEEEVCEALARHHDVDASDIEVAVAEGCVTLKGTVESKLAKRAAEMAIENLSGVQDVTNELKVKKAEMNSSDYASSYEANTNSSKNSANKTSGKTGTNGTSHIS